ncbi:unnamed protein product (macronuclear) [Paramecium tetraurelia]|uniref:Uncharacterized protein n=1 Tax=Paramecium tetraurelia TaxID=5888 RepID=A0CT55_PARTE|nr:uncharacterized protein GSPATT00010205001 [Paramecium tetraurelia]CAK73972.1 unnamed protein product [Paramecium tetraurelia]|eukprot:XP_001441369.1 hypothetical protein (macronuclear) [Paramecium tetraurelia strain d4-2]
MQQLKTKIKPPFLLDGVSAARRGKVLDYKPEKDIHLEQYYFNKKVREQVIKMKQDRMSQRNLAPLQSKSFDQTIHQQKQTQALNQSSSPQHQTATKVSNTQKVPNVSRSLSKEHFVTFLDSLITTVQNVQQLVITYFPQDQMDNKLSKQQDELRKISQATEQLSRKLRTNSLGSKKEVENVKTQKNFSKLPQIKKSEGHVSKTQRGREQQYQIHNQPTKNITTTASKTLEKNQNIEIHETDDHNFGFQNHESAQDNTIKKITTDKPVDHIQSHREPDTQQQKLLQIRSDQTTQLPSFRSSQQKPVYQYKKYHKEIQLVLTKPKQHKNEIQLVSQSPEQYKSKSVNTKDYLQKSQSRNLKKLDFKKITSNNISKTEQQKSKKILDGQEDAIKKSNTPPILIKITDIDKQPNVDQPRNEVQVEVVEEAVQNFSNDSGLFLIQQSQNQEQTQTQTLDEDKGKLNGTAFFKIVEEEERKETIGKMTESNEIQRSNVNEEGNKVKESNDQEKPQENAFIIMIQNQVIENDQKLLKQQQTNFNTINDVENGSQVLIKAAESIDPQSDQDVVNPLEDSEDQQRDHQESFLITTLEQNNQQVIEYQKENFEQES